MRALPLLLILVSCTPCEKGYHRNHYYPATVEMKQQNDMWVTVFHPAECNREWVCIERCSHPEQHPTLILPEQWDGKCQKVK